MEDVCPISKHKSLKDCPVLTHDENSDKKRRKIIVISILVKKMYESDYKESNIKLSSNKDITRETKIDTKVETEAAHKVTEENLIHCPY